MTRKGAATRGKRKKLPPPTHSQWEVLQLLAASKRTLLVHFASGKITWASVTAGSDGDTVPSLTASLFRSLRARRWIRRAKKGARKKPDPNGPDSQKFVLSKRGSKVVLQYQGKPPAPESPVAVLGREAVGGDDDASEDSE